MKLKVQTRRVILVTTLLVLAAAAGAITAMLGADAGLSYTEPAANPSVSGRHLALTAPAQRQPPRDFAFTDVDGHSQRLSAVQGQVTLVNLWATWCPPCVAEMPDLDALQALLGGTDFRVLAISLDRGGAATVARWFPRAGIRNLAIHNANPADFPDALLPTSILLDRQGRVAWTGAGIYAWTGQPTQALIKALIAEQ